jgi:hypothetical protein
MEVKTQHMEQLVNTKLELELELQTAVELKLKSGAMAEKIGLLRSEADELHEEVRWRLSTCVCFSDASSLLGYGNEN